MTERFRKAYDALVRAFFEGTLAKGTCLACACGNIIFSAIGKPIQACEINADKTRNDPSAFELWSGKRGMEIGNKYVALDRYKDEINAAGYTGSEFAEIENAFENNTLLDYKAYSYTSEQRVLEDQYNGLCAVVDVLLKLDEGKENPDELKAKFREHPKLQTV